MENQKFNNLINGNENRINIRRKIIIFISALALIVIGLLLKILLGNVSNNVTPIYGILAPIGTIKNDTIKINELRQNTNEIRKYKE
jgi:uncharacterized membrane protein YvbJ